MMKKVVLFILLSIFTFSFSITSASAEGTLRDMKNALQELKNQKAAQEAEKNKTQAEINAENNKIADAHNQVEQAESDIASAKIQIEESNAKIASMKEETEELLVFYQIMMGSNNSFIDYISSAGNVTDMMLRADAVEQILDYNQTKLTELENLILENEQLEVDLTKKQKELEANIITYQDSVAALENDLSNLVEVSLKIDDQIAYQEGMIEIYESMGCKDDQLIDECVSLNDTLRWAKPTTKGYISSGFGWRSFWLNGSLVNDYHNAVDVAGVPGATPLYAVANGYVSGIIWRSECGGNQVFLHVVVQGKKYTVNYAHMQDIYVKEGDRVNQNTVIGTMGGGGFTITRNGGWDRCSTGYHLHIAVATGFYGAECDGCYKYYNQFVANSIVPPMMPAYGNWYYSRF